MGLFGAEFIWAQSSWHIIPLGVRREKHQNLPINMPASFCASPLFISPCDFECIAPARIAVVTCAYGSCPEHKVDDLVKSGGTCTKESIPMRKELDSRVAILLIQRLAFCICACHHQMMTSTH